MKPAGPILLPSWLHSSSVQTLLDCIPNAHDTLKFVGGCVRDTLLGLPVKDIDIATVYPPKDIITFIESRGFKAIPISLDHGSVLAVINSHSFEITTLRKDIETFGRHAKIAFTDDWLEDAKRRDFTMNALYLSATGEIFDPWNGIEDLKQGSIKFIGNPSERVQEDYLRILRFFRFLAYYGHEKLDTRSYEACKKFHASIQKLPIERIQKELLSLCSAPKPLFSIKKMCEAKIFDILFKKDLRLDDSLLERFFHFEEQYLNLDLINPLRRLYVLNDALDLPALKHQKVFKFSKKEKGYFNILETLLEQESSSDANLLYHYPAHIVSDARLISAVQTNNTLKLNNHLTFLKNWKKPSFPLTGKALLNLGISEGPQIGKYLHEIEEWWISNNFSPEYEACLNEIIHRFKLPS